MSQKVFILLFYRRINGGTQNYLVNGPSLKPLFKMTIPISWSEWHKNNVQNSTIFASIAYQATTSALVKVICVQHMLVVPYGFGGPPPLACGNFLHKCDGQFDNFAKINRESILPAGW